MVRKKSEYGYFSIMHNLLKVLLETQFEIGRTCAELTLFALVRGRGLRSTATVP